MLVGRVMMAWMAVLPSRVVKSFLKHWHQHSLFCYFMFLYFSLSLNVCAFVYCEVKYFTLFRMRIFTIYAVFFAVFLGFIFRPVCLTTLGFLYKFQSKQEFYLASTVRFFSKNLFVLLKSWFIYRLSGVNFTSRRSTNCVCLQRWGSHTL